MKSSLVLYFTGLTVWAVLITGCNKHQPTDDEAVPTTATSAPENGTAQPAAVRPRVAPVTIAPAEADPGPTLAQLTVVVRRFAVERRQVPKSLNDVVAAGYLTALPAAPAGKQFAIEPKQLEVVLRNR
jgi:hypothetical protein